MIGGFFSMKYKKTIQMSRLLIETQENDQIPIKWQELQALVFYEKISKEKIQYSRSFSQKGVILSRLAVFACVSLGLLLPRSAYGQSFNLGHVSSPICEAIYPEVNLLESDSSWVSKSKEAPVILKTNKDIPALTQTISKKPEKCRILVGAGAFHELQTADLSVLKTLESVKKRKSLKERKRRKQCVCARGRSVTIFHC
jgi:hypothetical protein